ncbi:general transcriptional corepressor trfA-like, partial [Leptidea sinapis]|uniref:general transcriptional corepressor trfA-like n=1 Tax=Leptidea sinapis TaxID=189913 RepID=UPI0021C3750B
FLGTFGYFGVQSVKGRDPVYQSTKTTIQPQQPTKQAVFNSYNYSHNLKSTPSLYAVTTPKLQTTQNQIYFQQNNKSPSPTQQTKTTSNKDTKAGQGHSFKPSPQDPFTKNNLKNDVNKVTTYNPPITTNTNQYYNYNYVSQNSNQHNANVNYNNNNQQLDNVGLTQQVLHQYANPPNVVNYADDPINPGQYQASYEVTEKETDVITRPATGAWFQDAYDLNQQVTEASILTQDNFNSIMAKPVTVSEQPEEYAIVTEAEKLYENGLNYNNQFELQNRPQGEDYEPIEKNKLKDYYYRVPTTPSGRRTKKPAKVTQEVTTDIAATTETPVESLPTLPPSQHFKRPNSESLDKDKIRKRNKIRRRRPIGNRRNETSTTTTTETIQTTDEIHTIRPRIRPIKRTESPLTTPIITSELTTSALATEAPTAPTPMRKKLNHQRIMTTLGRADTTTQPTHEQEQNRESPIMKISSRLHTRQNYEYRNTDVPDYTHNQDEKETPTSDTSVDFRDNSKTEADILKEFSFHRDVRPVESTTESSKETVDIETTTQRTEKSNIGKIPKTNKYSRPKFSVKDYRNRLSSTTSSTEKATETYKQRFPQRKNPYSEINTEIETTTERRKFTPKEPRYKLNKTENIDQDIQSRHSSRIRQTTEAAETTTQRISSRIRNGQRRPKPTDETIETSSTTAGKRPLRKKIKDSETGESVQDITIGDAKSSHEHKNEITSERARSESAIMKIADKKHQDHIEKLFEHSKRVSDLTLAASKDYNTPGMFKTISANSRRIPNYFTIATDDPILPIEAFFPQLNQKKES